MTQQCFIITRLIITNLSNQIFILIAQKNLILCAFSNKNKIMVQIAEVQDDLKIIADSARDFAEQHIRPKMMEWDETQHFPKDVMHKLGEMGFLGVLVPEEYGGAGLGYQEYITVIEEVAKVCSSIGLSVAAHNSLCTGHILQFANEEQKKKYLVINGTKNWITHGKSGDVAVVIVRTGELLDSHGMSAFIVEHGTPGFSAGKKENKLGMRASETAELIFENCRVHKSQMLGNEGEGFIQSMKVLDGGRISIAALSLGIAKGAYEASVKYAKEREQFGKPIAKFQAISFKLADMLTKIQAAELLTRKAAHLKNTKQKVTTSSAIAKYYASEICVEIATDAVQIHGGYGYTKDFPVEKFYRDSKLCTIGEGTSEIQKLVISRNILKGEK